MMSAPLGLDLLSRLRGRNFRFSTYRYIVLLLTFFGYACYHASRKPTSIVKSVLDPVPPSVGLSYPWPVGELLVKRRQGVGYDYNNVTESYKKGWPPFDGKDGTVKLGEVDLAFLACYAVGMYVAGHLGDVLDLRLFLTGGMMGSGTFVMLFGVGYFSNIHSLAFYLAMQMIAGLFQATGWPSVVAVVGNWFGKRRRGLIMGIWNAHTSIGNIIGSLLAASNLQHGWGWSFILPGGLLFAGGILVFLFLPAHPEDVGLQSPNTISPDAKPRPRTDEEAQLHASPGGLRTNEDDQNTSVIKSTAVGLLEACRIPGVIPFAWCLFFSKLVAYTFLYWLPFYLSQTAIGGEYVSVKSAGNLSTLFDVGGIIGGILAGYISDKLNARATTAAAFMYIAIPCLWFYHLFGSISESWNIGLMMLTGLFVNGPYALITTAVSADLGTHSSLRGNSRALATVTAIIDGTGSIGAALGPLLTGFMSTWGWKAVFAMLSVGALAAAMLLTKLVVSEVKLMFCKTRCSSGSCQQGSRGVREPLLEDGR